MKISQKLKAKARGIRGKASTVARKGIIKGAGAAGYAAGRAGTEIASRPKVAKAVGKVGSAIGKVASKIPVPKVKVPNQVKNPSLRNQITGTKAAGAFIGGTLKGSYDGLSAAEKRNKKK
jgi:hypothetical protein